MIENDVTGLVRSESMETAVYRSYKRKWLVLLVISLLNMSNAMNWICFAPIVDLTKDFYSTSSDNVNYLSLVYMVVCVLVGLFASWIIDVLGLRTALILGSWINGVGALVKMLSCFEMVPSTAPGLDTWNWKFIVVFAGQTLCAFAQPFSLFASTKVASLWFGDSQRALANTAGSMANPLGILVANLMAPLIVTDRSQMLNLQISLTAVALVTAFLASVLVTSSKPPQPPSASAASDSMEFFQGLKEIMKNWRFIILFICMGVGVALFTALSTLIQQILHPYGYSDTFAGVCGALLIGAGICGAVVAGAIVDKTKKFEEVAKVCFAMSTIGGAAFTVCSRYEDRAVPIALSVAWFGFFGFALYPVILELGVEVTYPVAEATSSGLILLSGQLQAIVYMLLMTAVSQNFPEDDIRHLDDNSQDFTIPNYIFVSVAAFGACLFIVGFRADYRRMRAEQSATSPPMISRGDSTMSGISEAASDGV